MSRAFRADGGAARPRQPRRIRERRPAMPQILALPARLWRGGIPLGRAFWEFAVLYGTLANLFATIASMSLLAADVPGAVAVPVHLLPVPYNFLMVVAVWKSAARYRGPKIWADLARGAILLWALAASAA